MLDFLWGLVIHPVFEFLRREFRAFGRRVGDIELRENNVRRLEGTIGWERKYRLVVD